MHWYLAWPDVFWRFKYFWESKWLKWVKTEECPLHFLPKKCLKHANIQQVLFFNILHFFLSSCVHVSLDCFLCCLFDPLHTLSNFPSCLSASLSQRGGKTGKKLAFMHEEGIGDPTVWLCEKWSQTQTPKQGVWEVSDTKQICRKANH